MTSFDKFLSDADAEFDNAPIKTGKTEFTREKFTCTSCDGSGLWQGGRTNRNGNSKCNACGGTGFFVTSPEKRRKARAATAARKAKVRTAAMDQNMAHEVAPWIAENTDWNNFCASLIEQHMNGKAWSDKQVAAAERMKAKCEETRARKAAEKAEREANAPAIDLTPIADMFETAHASGYKKPMYRANGLRIKPGKEGALYVLTEDRMEDGYFGMQPGYEGKIADGKFIASRAAAEDTAAKLIAIAADPKGEAIRHGQRTGTCSCCGRSLTNHASIDAGIGPICAEKWGF
jgi:hypothetical protein